MQENRRKFDVETIPYPVVFAEQADFKDTYGGDQGLVLLESYLHRPVGVESSTVLVFMHPVGGGTYLPLVRALARAGHHVIYCNSRYRTDQALIMEKVVVDLGAAISDAKERLGYEKVVLAGWSGGGPLSMFYQEQARRPTITATPAGDLPDLTTAGLIPADAVMLLAAHPSRHTVLARSIDPSVLDEANPENRDPNLDIYGSGSPKPPYPQDWLEHYRSAQVARMRRITDEVLNRLASLKEQGRPHDEHAFIVHRTMADPAVFDGSIDPNDRKLGVSFIGDPEIANNGPVGLGRFSTLRSWLSQWSVDHAQGDAVRAAASLDVPFLALCNGADNVCLPLMVRGVFDAVPHDDKTFVTVEGANHYYIGSDQRVPLRTAANTCSEWLVARGFGDLD